MQYALESGNGTGMILIEEELKPAAMLLELWRIRQEEENIAIILDIDNEVKKLKFVSIVLLTLLENMLKHSNLSNAQHPSTMKIHVEDRHIILIT